MKLKHLLVTLMFAASFVAVPVFAEPTYDASKGLVPCGGYNPDGSEQAMCTFTDIMILINTVINFLIFTLALPIAAIVFAWAGFIFITEGSNQSKRTQAKNMMINVVIGLVLALASWLIVKTILVSLGVKINFLGIEM
ncbi:hypothetical protein IPF86_03100 [Candidatus Nomurabacteria bacterium]|jgi:cation transport ATPase|nr:MAG: hypothetical protein IPF86_03100 [Candidatus Nomurabacteria bacterium]